MFLPSGSQETTASEYQGRELTVLAENSFYNIQQPGEKYCKNHQIGSSSAALQGCSPQPRHNQAIPDTHNSGRIYKHSGHPPAPGCMQLEICYGVQSIDVFLLLHAIILYTSWYMLMCTAQSEHLFRNLHWRQIIHCTHPHIWLCCAYRCHLYSEQVMCSLFRNELFVRFEGWEERRRMPGWSVCAPALLSPFLAPFHDLRGKLQVTPPSEAIPQSQTLCAGATRSPNYHQLAN